MGENTAPVPRRHGAGRPFQPGQSGNPGGRPKALLPVVEAARAHTVMAIQTLADIAEHGESEQARVAATNALLDRAWGKPVQPVEGDGGLVIQVLTGIVRAPDDNH